MCFGLLWPRLHSLVLGTALLKVQGNAWRAPGRYFLVSTVQAFSLANRSYGAGKVSSHGCKATAGSATSLLASGI